MKKGLVAIAVPYYKSSSKYVEEAVRSCLAQDYENIIVIVCNDLEKGDPYFFEIVGSDIVKNDKILEIGNGRNRGAAYSRNNCIRWANRLGAEFIHFFDADDVAEPDMISKKLPLFDNELVGVVYSDYYNMTEDGKKVSVEFKPPFNRARLLEDNYISMISMARIEDINEAGGLNDMLTFGEDWALWRKITASKIAVRVPEPLFSYRMNPDSQTRQIDWTLYQMDMDIIQESEKVLGGHASFKDLMLKNNRKVNYLHGKSASINSNSCI